MKIALFRWFVHVSGTWAIIKLLCLCSCAIVFHYFDTYGELLKAKGELHQRLQRVSWDNIRHEMALMRPNLHGKLQVKSRSFQKFKNFSTVGGGAFELFSFFFNFPPTAQGLQPFFSFINASPITHLLFTRLETRGKKVLGLKCYDYIKYFDAVKMGKIYAFDAIWGISLRFFLLNYRTTQTLLLKWH